MKFKHVVSFQLNETGDEWTKDSRFYYGINSKLYSPLVKDITSAFYCTPLCSKLNKGERIYVSSGDVISANLESDALFEYLCDNFHKELHDGFYMELLHHVTLDNGGCVVMFGDNIYMDELALNFLESTISEADFYKLKDSLLDKFGSNYYLYI